MTLALHVAALRCALDFACDPSTVEGSIVRVFDKVTGELLVETCAPEADDVERMLAEIERTFPFFDPESPTGRVLIKIGRATAQQVASVRRQAEELYDRLALDEEWGEE